MADQNEVWLTMWIDGKPYDEAVDRILTLEIDERSEEASSFHASLDMTQVYTDPRLMDVTTALERLPGIPMPMETSTLH